MTWRHFSGQRGVASLVRAPDRQGAPREVPDRSGQASAVAIPSGCAL